MMFVGPTNRSGQGAELSTWVDSVGDEVLSSVKNGCSDGVTGWKGDRGISGSHHICDAGQQRQGKNRLMHLE